MDLLSGLWIGRVVSFRGCGRVNWHVLVALAQGREGDRSYKRSSRPRDVMMLEGSEGVLSSFLLSSLSGDGTIESRGHRKTS